MAAAPQEKSNSCLTTYWSRRLFKVWRLTKCDALSLPGPIPPTGADSATAHDQYKEERRAKPLPSGHIRLFQKRYTRLNPAMRSGASSVTPILTEGSMNQFLARRVVTANSRFRMSRLDPVISVPFSLSRPTTAPAVRMLKLTRSFSEKPMPSSYKTMSPGLRLSRSSVVR